MGRFTGILGLLTMLGLAYAFSTNRRAIRLKTVAWGLGLQLVFAVFYHYGVMQFVIKIAAWIMTRVMGASGAESLNVAASIFMGQTEAPLTIRPFLPDLTRSELMTVMTSGMAHVSGGIMAAYIAFGIEPKHLLSAVIMTAPGTLLMAKMLVPETEQPKTAGRVVMSEDELDKEKKENLLGAIARGKTDGLGM